MKNNIALGKAGELRVTSELLLRGIEVYLAITDSGVDLILSNGKRLQVKSAHRLLVDKNNPKWKCQHYTFSFKSWRKKEQQYKSHELEGVDFVVLWAVDDDAFFIIPVERIKGKYSVRLNPNSTKLVSQYMPFRDNWEALK